ncbi:competence protein ComJ [Enterobacter ludwigii]|uniref:competence protein ComJ n=2 Tax=Enterobacter ludwigii TaxID=299767 RepID=UPI0029C09874|nr:competence protein ComJ [Enterobacter ludwigii]
MNIEQGAIIHPDYVIFDPLPEDAFGANVNIRLVNDFILSVDAQRCIVVPFEVSDNNGFVVASAMEAVKINLDLTPGGYLVYFEICEGHEVYYNFSFVPADVPVAPMYLLDDPWGGVKGKKLHCGNL